MKPSMVIYLTPSDKGMAYSASPLSTTSAVSTVSGAGGGGWFSGFALRAAEWLVPCIIQAMRVTGT